MGIIPQTSLYQPNKVEIREGESCIYRKESLLKVRYAAPHTGVLSTSVSSKHYMARVTVGWGMKCTLALAP